MHFLLHFYGKSVHFVSEQSLVEVFIDHFIDERLLVDLQVITVDCQEVQASARLQFFQADAIL